MKCPRCQYQNPTDTRFCGQCGTSMDPDQSPTVTWQTPTFRLSRGSLFATRYEVIEEIGQGGMGTVYKVYDQKVKEKIAIKLIKPAVAFDPSILERFTQRPSTNVKAMLCSRSMFSVSGTSHAGCLNSTAQWISSGSTSRKP